MTPRIFAEVSAVAAVWIVLLWQAPEFFVWAYVPGYLAGLTLCYIHGYFEHRIATTSNYGFLYNVSFLNDGYHVEHLCNPALTGAGYRIASPRPPDPAGGRLSCDGSKS